MTESSTWLDGNTKYISAAVAWLRAVLEGYSAKQREPQPQILVPETIAPQVKAESGRPWRGLIHRPDYSTLTSPSVPTPALPSSTGGTAPALAQAEAALRQAESAIDP